MRSSLKLDLAGRRADEARDEVEDRGLPGAVGADETPEGARGKLRLKSFTAQQAAEELRDLANIEDRRRSSCRVRHFSPPPSPFEPRRSRCMPPVRRLHLDDPVRP